jgi:hypothetical protein
MHMASKLTVYLDESGNTGEVMVDATSIHSFHGQPYFVLGGFGVLDSQSDELEKEVLRLKQKYRIRSEELKSKTLYESKPQFILELFEYLHASKHPLFIELMDKRYYLAVQLVQTLALTPPLHRALEKEGKQIPLHLGRQFADYLHDTLPDEIFLKLCSACSLSTKESFKELLLHFLAEMRQRTDPIADELYTLVGSNLMIYDTLSYQPNLPKEPHKFFLPLPDTLPSGNSISLLPHTHAFLNVIGRTELFKSKENIDELAFVHDEIRGYQDIFAENFEKMKGLPAPDFIAEYLHHKVKLSIPQDVTLTFTPSPESTFVQVADIIAGFTMRSWSAISKNETLPDEYVDIHKKLSTWSTHLSVVGLNFVVSTQQLLLFWKRIDIQSRLKIY